MNPDLDLSTWLEMCERRISDGYERPVDTRWTTSKHAKKKKELYQEV